MWTREYRPAVKRAPRAQTAVSARLELPAENSMHDCAIMNISETGAGLLCKRPPPVHTNLILHAPGFGPIECVSSRWKDGLLGVRFIAALAHDETLLPKLWRWISRQSLPSKLESVRTLRLVKRGSNGK